MHDVKTRVSMVKTRVRERRKRNYTNQTACLGLLCALLTGLNISLISYLGDWGHYRSPEDWMYGATMLPSNVGGYVLVAVATFVVAVMITVICMKYKDR